MEHINSNVITLLGTYIQVGVTAAVLFFSISIIPFQQYASTYTPSIIKYLFYDINLGARYLTLVLLTTILIALPFLFPSNIAVLIGFILVNGILLVIISIWIFSIHSLDPSKYLIPAIGKDTKKSMDKCIVEYEKKQKMIAENYQELKETVLSKYKIPKTDLQPVFQKITILKELCICFLKTGQTEMFRIAMNELQTCIKHYFQKRKEYTNNIDDFILDVGDELKDILSFADKTPNLHSYRIIWRFIQDIAEKSLICDTIISHKEARHSIAISLIQILEQHIYQDIIEKRIDAAFEGVKVLGYIGRLYASKGYQASAEELSEKLKNISLSADQHHHYEVSSLAKDYISDIFYHMLFYRQLFINDHYSYFNIIKTYNELISTDKYIVGYTNSIIWYNADIFSDRSISSLINVGLFPNINQDEEIYYQIVSANLEIVDQLLDIMFKFYNKNSIIQSSFKTQIYHSALSLLAFIYHQITDNLLFFQQVVQIPTTHHIKSARNLLTKVRKFYYGILILSWQNKSGIYQIDELLHSFVSCLYLDIYWASQHSPQYLKEIKSEINTYIIQTYKIRKSLNLDEYELQMIKKFAVYLSNLDEFKKISTRLHKLSSAGLKLQKNHHYSSFLHLGVSLNNLKRPLTMNSTFFDDLDKEIFGK